MLSTALSTSARKLVMRRLTNFLLAGLAVAAPLWVAGCSESGEGHTAAEQLKAEQQDVREAQEKLEDARYDIGEQKQELQDARENLAEQTRELEQSEDAAGDAERQLAKEKADVEAERTDVDPAPQPQ